MIKRKCLRYIKMIREENKRMHGQVENVLRISRLEKNQIEINTEASDMHDVIEDAIISCKPSCQRQARINFNTFSSNSIRNFGQSISHDQCIG